MIANLMGGDGIIVLIVAIVVLVGGSQLPKIARNVGLAGKEFRKAQSEAEEEAAKAKAKKAQEPPAPAPLPAGQDPVAQAPSAAATNDGSITLSPAQLDALLKSRQVQGEASN